MNKKELEKMLYDKFGLLYNVEYTDDGKIISDNRGDEIENFIFETIIPEVLKSVIPKKSSRNKVVFLNTIIGNVEQKVKELYGIDL